MSAETVSARVQTIRSRLTERMIATGLGPSQLSTRAGLNPTAVHAIMSGKSTNPGVDTIEALAKALGCDLGYLILHGRECGGRPPVHEEVTSRHRKSSLDDEFKTPVPDVEIDVLEELDAIELASARIRNFVMRHRYLKG